MTTRDKGRDKGRKKVEGLAQQLTRLEIQWLPTTALNPNPWNPNRQSDHDFELLKRSMREDGFTQPVLVVELTAEHTADHRLGKYQIGDTVIVDGEHRWRAARSLNIPEIPVVFVPQLPEQMRIATLRHNRARGSEDIGLAADVLRDLQMLGAIDWAQDALLIDDTELNNMLADISVDEALASPEFSEAWAPTQDPGDDLDGMHTGLAKTVSTTQAAADLIRQREKALATAKTLQERQKIIADLAVYRIGLTFTGEEATVIKAVLEPSPARQLLELCAAEMARREADLRSREAEAIVG
jgi:ParB-like chromosome segregation protein Spo0J